MTNELYAAEATEHAAQATGHAAEAAGHAAEHLQYGDPGYASYVTDHLVAHLYDHTLIRIDWHPFGLQWLDLSITKLTLMIWIAGAAIFLLFRTLAVKQTKRGTSGRYVNFFEPFVLYVRNEMVFSLIGEKYGRKYLPLFLTQFFFILACNLLGMIPFMATATGNLAVCASLAFTTLVTIFVMGMIEQGPVAFWKHLVPPGMPVMLLPILFPIELLGIFIKSFALMIRLFANMVAGHIVILSFIGMIFIFHSYFVALPAIAFALFINLLELFVAFLQAFIFTLLSIIFVGMAINPEH
ncbi:MAG: F0F1 ATP synthase subunit A [Gemmatimonadota bacterium]|nr:F0F1 ATP synthase subunit A [Gemmatimonadota bacterium]